MLCGTTMASSLMLFLVLLLSALCQGSVHANFASDMTCIWGPSNYNEWNNGDNLQLKLTHDSGCAIQSYNQYMFGSITLQIQLVGGNSAGTVTTYYLSSSGDYHDEIDFEFLGNVSGQPYVIHTNVFTLGQGNREEQFYPWFDPTDGFHNYTIHWNPNQIVWFIDSVPIRVFKNHWSNGIPFPNEQGMKVYSSIWNGDDWATQGGRVKIDWNSAPFVASYQSLELRSCPWYGEGSTYQCSQASDPQNWWTAPEYGSLSYDQQGQLQWVRQNYMIYDYCQDGKRFNWNMPPECSLPMV